MPRKQPEDGALDFSKSLQKLSPDRFFRFIREYPRAEGTSVYIYRLAPVINRAQVGIKTSYIEVTTAAVDDEYLLRTHGSGRYHLMFSDANKPKGLSEVAKTTVEIWDPHVEPSVNPAELVVNAPGNDKWVQRYLAVGWTVEDGKLRQPAPAASETGVLAKTVRELAERIAAKAPERESGDDVVRRALDVLTQPRGGDDLDRAFKIADRMKPAEINPVELIKTVVDLVDRRGRPAAEQALPVNPIMQLKETAALLKEFGWGARQAAPAGSSWTDVVTALPGILQYGAEFVGNLVRLRMMGPMPPAALAAQPNPNAAGAPAATRGGTLNPMDMQAFIEAGRDAIDAFERGIDGDDFAHALVCRRDGEDLYVKLAGMGKDGILSAMSMVPGLAEKLAPKRAEMEAWLDAFIRYGEEPAAAGQNAA